MTIKKQKFNPPPLQWTYNRYIGKDPKLAEEYEQEVLNAEIARKIYDLRMWGSHYWLQPAFSRPPRRRASPTSRPEGRLAAKNGWPHGCSHLADPTFP